MSPVLAIWESPVQLMVVGFIALLLFGKRLPEVMRSLGKGITEFKKGMNGLEDEFNRSSYTPSQPQFHEPARPLLVEERPVVADPKVPAADQGSREAAAHESGLTATNPA